MKKWLIGLGLCALLLVPSGYKQLRRDSFLPTQVVKLLGAGGVGSCSGIHVKYKKTTYILSAAHCKGLANDQDEILVQSDESPVPMLRKVLFEANNTDLIILEALPDVAGISIAKLKPTVGELLYSYTHGFGYDTHKTEGIYIQKDMIEFALYPVIDDLTYNNCTSKKKQFVKFMFFLEMCMLKLDVYVTKVPAAPGSSGGPVVNKYGELMGLVSAGNNFYTYLVQLEDIQEAFKDFDK